MLHARLVSSLFLALILVITACAPATAPPAPAQPAAPAPAAPAAPAKKEPVAKPGVEMPRDLVMGPVLGTATIYDVALGFMSDRLLKAYPGTRIRTLPGSSEDSIIQVQNKEAMVGLTLATAARQAYYGEGKWKTPSENLRLLTAYAYQSVPVILVLEDSPIRSFKDVVGKRIGIGPPGGFGGVLFLDTLKYGYGITQEQIEKAGGRVQRTAHADEAKQVAAGQLDGAVYFGHPFAPWVEVSLTRNIRVIGPDPEAIQKTIANYPAGVVQAYAVPANIYKGQTKEIPVVGARVLFIAHKDLPDDVAYNLMTTWFSDDAIKTAWRSDKRFDYDWVQAGCDIVKSPPVPVHPGAARYWKDRGC